MVDERLKARDLCRMRSEGPDVHSRLKRSCLLRVVKGRDFA